MNALWTSANGPRGCPIYIVWTNSGQQTDVCLLFQREKQCKLNQVNCVVILKLHQLQHLISKNQVNNVGDTLVFSQATLSRLYKRVGQLHNETLQQKAKHKY